jgi:hypothetical protein
MCDHNGCDGGKEELERRVYGANGAIFAVKTAAFEKARVPAALVDHAMATATAVVMIHTRSTMDSMTR